MKTETWRWRSWNAINVIAFVMVLALLSQIAEPLLAVDVQRSTDLTAEAAVAEHNCRFWAMISENAPAGVIQDHLVDLPNSIENLSPANPDGWSVGYYADGNSIPTVNRGFPRAIDDPNFDLAVTEAATRSGSSHRSPAPVIARPSRTA